MSKKINHALRYLLKVTFGLVFLTVISCQAVKPYQRTYLNDAAMKMGYEKGSSFERYAQMIREGANGASGKNSGGCGCN